MEIPVHLVKLGSFMGDRYGPESMRIIRFRESPGGGRGAAIVPSFVFSNSLAKFQIFELKTKRLVTELTAILFSGKIAFRRCFCYSNR